MRGLPRDRSKNNSSGVYLSLEGDLNFQDIMYENIGSVVKLGITRRIVNPKILIKTKDLMIHHP